MSECLSPEAELELRDRVCALEDALDDIHEYLDDEARLLRFSDDLSDEDTARRDTLLDTRCRLEEIARSRLR